MNSRESSHETEEQKAAATTDHITILKSATGTASKRVIVRPDLAPLIEDYNAGFQFFFIEVSVSDMRELSAALRAVEAVRGALVIRGAPRADLDSTKQLRRLKSNFRTPASGRRWILVDFDKIPLPPGVSLQQDVGAVCEYLVGRLPTEFHAVWYHWQLSTKAGLFEPAIVSMHLWFWLDRPIPDTELKRWARWWNDKSGFKVIDVALFSDVQPHYTAAPQFVGMTDPFPIRSGLQRKATDEVALKLPPANMRTHKSAVPLGTTSIGFDEILSEIGDHPGGQGFHLPIIRAVASYVATHGREETNIEALYEAVRARVLAADRSCHDEAYVEQMASRDHIVSAIDSAISKYGNTDNPRRKSRQIEGIAPHFEHKTTSVAKASAQLQDAIDDFFR